jgi:hypothetical protein
MKGDDPSLPPLSCEVGDLVELLISGMATPWPDQTAERFEAGARYRVGGLVGWGWDLEKVSGVGPDQLRILNSLMPESVAIVDEADQG